MMVEELTTVGVMDIKGEDISVVPVYEGNTHKGHSGRGNQIEADD